ncbi:MAG: hypothetical protein U0174_22000 [Polyangiaceae bacterium]
MAPTRLPCSAACGAFLAALSLVGCGGGPKFPEAEKLPAMPESPFGPSYVLQPLPNEDDSLLGRVLGALPEPGRSLEEVAQPNPCLDKLTEPKPSPLTSTFDSAEELAAGARGKAVLGSFGFSADANRATHLVYHLETQRRIARTDTVEYAACCKVRGCGYGFVSALVYGDGDYSTAEETTGAARAEFAVMSASGSAKVRTLHRRKGARIRRCSRESHGRDAKQGRRRVWCGGGGGHQARG